MTGPHGRQFIPLLVVFIIAACDRPATPIASAQSAPPANPSDAERAAALIRPADMAARIGFLSHDLMGGRLTPSPGLTLAAEYIASEFATMGLEPGGDSGSFVQWYPLGASARAPNVVGILRGSDPVLRDTYVVFSAHMDHVGIGPPDASGDSIYNGADDDASGTSAVIEIAEAFASLEQRPARSIVFLAVSGEETGLFGSEAFVQKGRIPATSLVADINIDMIGRNAPDSVVIIGLAYSELGTRVIETASRHPELGLAVIDDPWPAEQFFFRSDHYNFAIAGVPAVFFFAGVHADYHQPSDEVAKIDADKAARIARLAFHVGLGVASSSDAPAWSRKGLSEVRPRNVR